MNEYEQRLAEARKKAAEGAARAKATNAKESGEEWVSKVAQMSGQGQLAGAAKSKGEYDDRVRENAPKAAQLADQNAIARDAANDASIMARAKEFNRGDMIVRNNALMGIAGQAGQAYDAASGQAMATGAEQRGLGELIRASAMGQGPSVAGMQGAVQGDRMTRQAAGMASGGLLAQRNAASGMAMGGNDLASQVASARAGEQAQQQSVLAQNLRAMQGANLGAAGMASDRQLGFMGQADADMFGNASLEQRANSANFESEEQMRQRAARSVLINMGREEARAAQSAANRQANAQAAIAGGTMLGGVAADTISKSDAWKKWKGGK